METFDVLNEYGEFIGKTATREECHKNGYWHRAVYAFIIDDKGTTIECTSSTPSVVKSTLAARLSNYALWWGSNYHVYQYRI